MIECLSVFRVQTGPVLQRTVDEDHYLPGQPFDALERLGKLPVWVFERFSSVVISPWHAISIGAKRGLYAVRKTGQLLEVMFRCRTIRKSR